MTRDVCGLWSLQCVSWLVIIRGALSDRVMELRREYESQLENLDQQLQREKVIHDHIKAFNALYLPTPKRSKRIFPPGRRFAMVLEKGYQQSDWNDFGDAVQKVLYKMYRS